MLAATLGAAADDPHLSPLSFGYVSAVSPNGKYVGGCESRSGGPIFTSFVYDVETGFTDWVTQYDEELPEEAGHIVAIGNSGLLVGYLRDPEWMAPMAQESYDGSKLMENQMLMTACVWKDGKIIRLDHNCYEDVTTFVSSDPGNPYPKYTDGFIPTAISRDEKTIIGYIDFLSHKYPLRWVWNEEEGRYVSTQFAKPDGLSMKTFIGASADCGTVVFENGSGSGDSYYWRNGDIENGRKFVPTEAGHTLTDSRICAISPSGNLALFECMRDSKWSYGVYHFDDETIDWLPVIEEVGTYRWPVASIIDDNGCCFMNDYNYKLYYFDSKKGIGMSMPQYLEMFETPIEGLSSFDLSKGQVVGVSDDGLTLAGNVFQGKTGLTTTGWVLRLPNEKTTVDKISGLRAFFSSPTELTCKWDALTLEGERSIDHYELTINGVKHNVDAAATSFATPMALGTYNVSIYAVINEGSRQKQSITSETSVSEVAKTSLYFYEDLNDSEFNDKGLAYVYIHDTFHPVASSDPQNLNFKLDVRHFDNATPFWDGGSISRGNWDTYLESRWFDATGQSDFYFTYQLTNFLVNGYDRHESNVLSLEYTTDGETWIPMCTDDAVTIGNKWHVRVIDMSELYGKAFKLRFHANGTGMSDIEWGIDFIGMRPDTEIYAAPKDVLLHETRDGVKVYWKNGLGEYEISHNYNSPMTYNQNVGNEGKPLLVANEYDNKKLEPFVGKYITSVATLIYEAESDEFVQNYHTTVEAVVYDAATNSELSRGKMADDAPWYNWLVDPILPIHHINLDTPVEIEAGKTYYVAIRISNYEPKMCPIWYFSASDDYESGVTDLYSEDDGETWDWFSEIYGDADPEIRDAYGRCIFNVRPCITDEPVAAAPLYPQMQWFYQVFRDGEVATQGVRYYTQQSWEDTDAVKGMAYTVQSYGRDGSCSRMSEPAVYGASSVEEITTGNAGDYAINDGVITAGADATLYTLSGIAVASGRRIDTRKLEHGVYMLVVVDGSSRSTYKIAL